MNSLLSGFTKLSAIFVLCAIAVSFQPLVAQDELPADVQADQYLLAAQAKMKANDMSAASTYFKNILDLHVTVPVDFHYHYGNCLVQMQDYSTAKTELTAYLRQAGRNGKFYQEALQLLNGSAEGVQRKEAANTAKIDRIRKLKELSRISDINIEADANNFEYYADYKFSSRGHSFTVNFKLTKRSATHIYAPGEGPRYSIEEKIGNFDIADVAEITSNNTIALNNPVDVTIKLTATHATTDSDAESTGTLRSLSGHNVSSELVREIRTLMQIEKEYSDITQTDMNNYDKAMSERK